MKHDVLELRQPVLELGLEVGLVEEFRVRQPRADDALVAGNDGRTAVAGLDIGDENELVGELSRLGIVDDKTLLVVADGGADHLVRNRQEGFVERPRQHHRPFDQPRDFIEQALVLDQFEPLRESEVPGFGEDDILAAGGIEHHPCVEQLRFVVLEAAHAEFGGRHEAVAARRLPGRDAGDVERHHVRLLGLHAEGRDNRMQRPHPVQRAGFRGAFAPAHRLGPREGADDDGHDLGDDVDRGPAFLLDQRDVEIALLRVFLDFCFVERLQAGGLEEALNRRLGRADLRPLALVLQVGLPRRQAVHGEREAARRHERLGALIDQSFGDQLVGHHLAQVVGGLRLHARGDFLGEQLEQKIRHVVSLPSPRHRLTLPSRGRVACQRRAGWGGAHRVVDCIQHGSCPAHHVIVPESQHPITFRIQPARSHSIAASPVVGPVLRSIDFDDKPHGKTGKIRNVRSDHDLPSEMTSLDLEPAQMMPENCFGTGSIQTQSPCRAPFEITDRPFHHGIHPTPLAARATLPLKGRVARQSYPTPPASVWTHASPQAFASSRTRRM